MSARSDAGLRGWIVGVAVAAVALGGCATTGGEAGDGRSLGVTMLQGDERPSLIAGESRVIAQHVSPRVKVQLQAEDGALTVRFGHSQFHGAMLRVDPTSLAAVGTEVDAPAPELSLSPSARVRVALAGGRFVECWKHGDAEQGYRVVAQAWTANGAPLGAPVAISPSDADVLGAPQLVAIDRERAIVAFVTITDSRAELVGVPIRL